MSSFDDDLAKRAELIAFFGPGFGWLFGGDDGTTKRSSTAAVGYDGGLQVRAGGERVVTADENHQMRSGWDLAWDDGTLRAGSSSGFKRVDDSGAVVDDSRRTHLSASGDGATVGRDSAQTRTDGDFQRQLASTALFGWLAGGPVAEVSRAESETNGVTARSREVGMGWGEGGFSARIARGDEVAFDEHNARANRSEISFAGGQLNGTRSTSVREQDLDNPGIVNGRTTSTSAGYGAKGLELQRTTGQSTQVDNQTFGTSRTTGYSNGQVTTASGRTVETVGADGTKTTEGQSNQFGFGRDGASWQNTRTRAVEGGAAQATSTNLAVDLEQRRIGGGMSHTRTAANGSQTSVAAKGSLGVDESGGLNHAAGSLSVGAKGVKATVSGEYSVTAGVPRQEGDQWVVDWTRAVKGGAGGGAKGISIGGQKSSSDFGTRIFRSKDEAETFQRNAASMLPTKGPDPTTAAGALTMEIGESRGSGNASSMGIDASLQMNVTSLGAGMSKGKSSAQKIERVSDTVFLVTREKGSSSGKSVSAGIGPAGVTGSSSDESSSGQTVRFDLSTPTGKAAFEQYNQTGVLPEQGGQVVSQTEAEKHRHGTGISLGRLGSASIDSTTWQSDTRDENGDRTQVFGGENAESVSWLGDSGSARFRLVQTERNDIDRTYSLQAFSQSNQGSYNREHLARFTGYSHETGGKAKASGNWRVDMEMREAEMQAFIDRKLMNERQDRGLFGEDERVRLTRELHDAKDTDARMKAIAKYVADDGFQGDARRHIENMLGKDLVMDVALEGDRNFKGAGARYELESKIARYHEMMQADPGAAGPLTASIQGEIDEIKRRKAEVMDPERYTDLPSNLRAMEAQKFDGMMAQLVELRRTAAIEATKLTPGQPMPVDEQAEIDADTSADPQLRQLKQLRHDIHGVDANIQAAVANGTQAQEEMKQFTDYRMINANPRLNGPWLEYRKARDVFKSGRDMADSVHELRAQFVLAFGRPGEAAAIGGVIVEQLRTALAIIDQGATMIGDALGNAVTVADAPIRIEMPEDMAPHERILYFERVRKAEERRDAALDNSGFEGTNERMMRGLRDHSAKRGQ